MQHFTILLTLVMVSSMTIELLEVFHQSIDWQSTYQPNYEKQMQKLDKQISIMKEQRRSKNQQCDRISRGLDFINNEKEKNEKFTTWLQSRIGQNEKRVVNLKQIRCQTSSSFYETFNEQLRVNKMNQFFMQWISRDQKLLQLQDTQSFIQELQQDNEFADTLAILTEQIRSCKLSPFKQTINRSTAERRDFESNIFDLEKLLTKNNEILEVNFKRLQVDQVRSQDKIEKFIQQLDKETEQLQIHYESILKILSKNPVEGSQKQRLEQCKKEVVGIDKLIQATEEALRRIQTCSPSQGQTYRQKKILSEIAKEYDIGVAKFSDE